jgi:GTP-binding protein
LKIVVAPNTGPFAGRDGKFVTSRQLEERLNRELRTNIGLKLTTNQDGIGWVLAGRGELHLAVLFETMRREGYEFQVGKPEVIKKEVNGVMSEPYEELTIEIDVGFIGVITEELGKRRADLLDTHTDDRGITRMVYKVSSQNLLGFRGDILTKTRGNGIFASRFIGYFEASPKLPKLRNGVILATETGKTTGYALETVQERGRPFVGPGVDVYEGMIVGLHSRNEDIEVNICRSKKLTNVHSATAEMNTKLDSPLIMSLEQCLDFIEEDELLEVTPSFLRLRKRHLTKVDRVRSQRA